MRYATILILALALVLSGCADDSDDGGNATNNGANNGANNGDNNGDNNGEGDTGDSEDTGADIDEGDTTEPDVPEPTCPVPDEPYGTSEGSRFFPLTLNTCAGDPYEFYGEAEGFCEYKYSVLSVGAGWCGPCRLEAELMQEHLVDAYADKGVRVVVAIIQDNNYAEPSPAFCQGWVDQYGLTNPVLLDPAQETNIYFPAGALPSTLIVDSEGVIVHREYGVSTELQTVKDALDELLAEE